MDQPPQVTIKDIPHSEAVETHIRDEIDKLEQFFDHIVSCQIVVEQTQKHQNTGKLHSIRIRLSVPGRELTANNNEDENLYKAIRDGFDNMRRQLEAFSKQIRGHGKAHAETLQGEIIRLFEDRDFGFITTSNGSEYYFNASNLVTTKFHQLKIGDIVHFIEGIGDDGLQAHHVKTRKNQD